MEKLRDAELEEIREKRKKLDAAAAAKKEKEKEEKEEKPARNVDFEAHATPTPNEEADGQSRESNLNGTIEWHSPRLASRIHASLMEVSAAGAK